MTQDGGRRYQAIISDYGGVLTSNTRQTMGSFCVAEDIDPEAFGALMQEWLATSTAVSPLHALETGAISGAEFEAALAARLRRRDGSPIAGAGLLTRLFADSLESGVLIDVFHLAKAAGLRIGLLSNSWANDYPTHLWGDVFDDPGGLRRGRAPQAAARDL